MSVSAPLILAYAANDDVTTPRSRLWRILWILAALPATVVPVLDFTWSVSPLDVAREVMQDGYRVELEIICAGLTFFVVYPLIAWRLRLALWRRPGVIESRAAIVAAALCMAGPMTLIIKAVPEIFTPQVDWLEVVIFFGTLLGGVTGGVWIAWRCRRSPAAADALMMGAYLGNAMFCLYAFRDDPDAGYWVTLAVCAIFLPQLILLPLATRRRVYVA